MGFASNPLQVHRLDWDLNSKLTYCCLKYTQAFKSLKVALKKTIKLQIPVPISWPLAMKDPKKLFLLPLWETHCAFPSSFSCSSFTQRIRFPERGKKLQVHFSQHYSISTYTIENTRLALLLLPIQGWLPEYSILGLVIYIYWYTYRWSHVVLSKTEKGSFLSFWVLIESMPKKKKRKIRKRQFTGNPPSWPLYSGLLTYQKWSRDTEYLACSKKQQKFLSKTSCLSAGMPASVSNTPSLLFSFSQNNFLVNKYRARL